MWYGVALVKTDVSEVSNRLTLPRSRYSFYLEDQSDTFLRNVGL
jgi:hypothetical protein